MDRSSNQNSCGVRLVLQTPSGEHKEYAISIGFKITNNEAEYEALLAGLRVATELRVESLDTFSDSQLVVNQVQEDYLAKDLNSLLSIRISKKAKNLLNSLSLLHRHYWTCTKD